MIIQKQNRDVAVLISMAEFDKLRGLRLQVLDRIEREIAADARTKGFTEQQLEEMIADVS